MTEEVKITMLSGAAWQKRRRQLLDGGGDIQKITFADGVGRFGEQMTEQDLRILLQAHKEQKRNKKCLKEDVKRSVARVILPDGRKIIVKEYHRIRFWLRFSADARGWLGSWRLQGSAQCLGWFRSTTEKRGFLFFADAGERDLIYKNQVVIAEKVRNEFYQAGVICGTLHRLSVFHSDLKPSNFVVNALGKVTLIDCDDVRVPWHFPRRLMLRNLAQLLGGIYYLSPDKMNMIASRAFFLGYDQQMPDMRPFIDSQLLEIRQVAYRLYPPKKDSITAFFQELMNERSTQSR